MNYDFQNKRKINKEIQNYPYILLAHFWVFQLVVRPRKQVSRQLIVDVSSLCSIAVRLQTGVLSSQRLQCAPQIHS
jgi:hypothetical protein